jgi:adenylosuccinate synthase
MGRRKVYLVTDLGPGDGGKGGVVHKVATLKRAHTIIKRGGAQGSHGVRTAAGESFAFSQWSCGTFEGVRTHLSDQMVIFPEGILNEADALRYGYGITDPYDLLTVDENAICGIGFHQNASHLKELARGANPRGTIGTGVGVAYRYSNQYPELTIRARDLARPELRELLAAIRSQLLRDLDEIIHGAFLPADQLAAKAEIILLQDLKNEYLDFLVGRCRLAAARMKIVDHEYLGREILARDGVVVVECSHGVLTDHYQGFSPHVSAIRTLPRFPLAMLEEAGYDGEVVKLGVTRAYQIFHGAGPLPTEDPSMVESLLPGSNKDPSRYQGKVRVGPLDFNLLRYSVECCGGPEAVDGLAVTWFDQIRANGEWRICDHYAGADDPEFFTPEGRLRVRFGEDDAQIARQEALGRALSRCRPEITTIPIDPSASREELFQLVDGVFRERLGVPVRMVSFGPTEKDKLCL